MTLRAATQFEIPVGELPTKSPRGLWVPRGPQGPPSASGPPLCHQPRAVRQHHLLRFVSSQIQKGPFPTCGVSRGLAYSAAGCCWDRHGPPCPGRKQMSATEALGRQRRAQLRVLSEDPRSVLPRLLEESGSRYNIRLLEAGLCFIFLFEVQPLTDISATALSEGFTILGR